MMFLAQSEPEYNFWAMEPGLRAFVILGIVFCVGMVAMFLLSKVPTRARRPIVFTFTFLSGAFYVLYYLWPAPIDRGPLDVPQGMVDSGGFLLEDALPKVASVANIVTAFLLGLGIFSLVRIHFNRFRKKQEDWFFSAVLLAAMIVMVGVGYWDYWLKQFGPDADKLVLRANWTRINYIYDLLFDGLIQQMDAAMFSLIAFFILSAAYRAFRIRSIEATVMMGSALILIVSLMGAVDFMWSGVIDNVTGDNSSHFLNNFKLDVVANWVKSYMQIPSLRALEFGVGLGALAMGLRIWLGLEKGGVSV